MLTDLPAKHHQLLPIVDEKVARDELRVIKRLRKEMAIPKGGGDGAGASADAGEGEGEGGGEGGDDGAGEGAGEGEGGDGPGPCAAAGVREADVLESALSVWGGAGLLRADGEAFRGGDLALLQPWPQP